MKSVIDNEMKLEFKSKSNNEAFARIAVAAFAAQLDPTIEELADIKTAVSEAVTNSIIHGYEDKAGNIKIIPLYSKQGQAAKCIIIMAEKGSHGLTSILPPLYTHNEDGSYSDMAEQILRGAKGFFE